MFKSREKDMTQVISTFVFTILLERNVLSLSYDIMLEFFNIQGSFSVSIFAPIGVGLLRESFEVRDNLAPRDPNTLCCRVVMTRVMTIESLFFGDST